jgi:hypothetical protein
MVTNTDKQTPDPLVTARAYHKAWTHHEYERAAALLSDDLVVEVPVNDYPTPASFAAAVAITGDMTRRVDLLAELGGAGQAMLLYDMELTGIGILRVAEHFTIEGERIVRIRQIHDTAPIRAAGLAR